MSEPAVRLDATANALCLRRRKALRVPQQTGSGGDVAYQWVAGQTYCLYEPPRLLRPHLRCDADYCNDAGTGFQLCHAK